VAALFANAAPYLLFAVAEQHVDSSTAGIINATTPLWTVVLALAVRHQKSVTSWQAAGLIVGFAGAVLIFTPWHTAGGLVSAGGLECLAASISYAVSYIYMDRFLARRGLGSVLLSACQLLAASVMLAIALLVVGVQTPHVTAESVGALVVLGIIGTGFAYVLNYQIITSEGATVASTVTYLLPVVAIVLGVLVLGESITVIVLAGIALVLMGVALTRRQVKPARANTNSNTPRELLQLSPRLQGRTFGAPRLTAGTGYTSRRQQPRKRRAAEVTGRRQPGRPGSRRCGAAASLASFGRRPYGRGGCRTRLPRHWPPPVPAVTPPDAAPHGQVRPSPSRQMRRSPREGHSHRHRNAAHCPGRPLQRQRCSASALRADAPTARR
jgi:drug/metabolite transporter (DMT)-like permease